MRRGYWKNGGRETLCVHPCSLASLHLSSSPSFSVSLPFSVSPTLFSSVSRTLSPLFDCFFLTYHISAPCGPTGHHIRVCGCVHSHSSVADIFGSVLISCCHSNFFALFTGKLTGKHSVIVVSCLRVWRCRQSAVRGWMSGAEEGCSPSVFGVVLHVGSNTL